MKRKRAKRTDKSQSFKRKRQATGWFSGLFQGKKNKKIIDVPLPSETIIAAQSDLDQIAADHHPQNETVISEIAPAILTSEETVFVHEEKKADTVEVSAETSPIGEEVVRASLSETMPPEPVVNSLVAAEPVKENVSLSETSIAPASQSEEVPKPAKLKKTGKKQGKITKRKKFLFGVLFVFGFLIMAYPFVSQVYYRIQANRVIDTFDKEVASMDNSELSKRYKLAQAFNAALQPSEIQDPFTEDEKKAGRTEYANMLKINEQIGYVNIPKINQKIPMFVGVADHVLEQGAGLLEGTSLPVGGDSTHTVISAHRGLPTARLFTDLDKMKKGDVFYIHVLDTILAYEVDNIEVVEPDNFDPILIQEGKDYATLLTCTPYMVNTHRLLVRGKRIPYTAPVEEKLIETNRSIQFWRILFIISVIIILILLYLIYRIRKLLRQQREKVEVK